MKEAHSDLESARQQAIAIANTLSLINEDRDHELCSAESFLALRASQVTIMAIEKGQAVLIDSYERADGFKEAVSMDSSDIAIADALITNAQALEVSLKSMATRLSSKPFYKLWVEKAYMSAAEAGYWLVQLRANIIPEPVEEAPTTDPESTDAGNGGDAVMNVSKEGDAPEPTSTPAPEEPMPQEPGNTSGPGTTVEQSPPPHTEADEDPGSVQPPNEESAPADTSSEKKDVREPKDKNKDKKKP
jgi:hypothetical protein